MKMEESLAGGRFARGPLLLLIVCITALTGAGCDVDSFLDPSETGRYENTPVVLPILERLDVIEEPEQMIAGLSEIRSEDLIPEIREYVMGPGDVITVTVFELVNPGVETVQNRRIDELGYIRLPIINQIKAAGLTTKQLEDKIIDILENQMGILRDPLVTVIVQEGRQRAFSILGATGSGTYTIVQNNFRLLDALALAGGLPPDTDKIYVIRQVPLAPEVEQGFAPVTTPEAPAQPGQPGEPGAARPDGEQPALDPGALIERLSQGLEPGQQTPGTPGRPDAEQPPVQPSPPLTQALEQPQQAEGRFINVNGKWVWVESAAAQQAQGGVNGEQQPQQVDDGGLPPPEQLVTQRVIAIDGDALLRGEATQNIVIRPGDVIRVPDFLVGNVYIGGPGISRGGTYALPGEDKLTLKQLIISAGGLSPVGIPERVDLIRRLGKQQEAYVRLNYRAIAEGVQPDIFLKPDDTITVGTNVFASHLAVIRNSFRSSYGFGFLLDRNFGSDVFGASPESVGGAANN